MVVRSLAAIGLVVLLSAGLRPAAADQDDPRLDRLFAILQESEDPREVRAAEAAIWTIWIEVDDEAVAEMMARGVAAMQRQAYKEALALFDEMVDLRPGFAEAWNKRATVHYLLGNHRESLADIAATLEREPRHFGALSGRGLVYVALGDEVAALESFEAALRVHPKLAGARINAETLRRRNQPI